MWSLFVKVQVKSFCQNVRPFSFTQFQPLKCPHSYFCTIQFCRQNVPSSMFPPIWNLLNQDLQTFDLVWWGDTLKSLPRFVTKSTIVLQIMFWRTQTPRDLEIEMLSKISGGWWLFAKKKFPKKRGSYLFSSFAAINFKSFIRHPFAHKVGMKGNKFYQISLSWIIFFTSFPFITISRVKIHIK